MQIRISDLMDDCCPEGVELGAADEQLTQRIKAEVLNKIKDGDRTPRRRNVTRILLLAAVIATLMTATAFAAGLFGMHRETVPAGEIPSGYWRFYDDTGKLVEEQKLVYPDAGLVFTFTGPDRPRYQLEIKPGWLPEGEHYVECFRSDYAGDGWGNGFGAFCSHGHIPCQIFAYEVDTRGRMSVLNAEPVTIEEETWDNWKVTKVVADYSNTEWSRLNKYWSIVNYILMFDEEQGILAIVQGEDSMDTLEKIAKNLEIRETDTPMPQGSPQDEIQISMMDIGRG